MNSRPELTRKELDQEALQCAAAALERELVEKHRRIINQGAVGSASSRMLLEASKHGHGYVIEYLAEIGVPLDAPLDANDWNRRTAAHYSAKNGQAEALEVLARLGAPCDAPDMSGMTPAHYAAINGHEEALGVL